MKIIISAFISIFISLNVGAQIKSTKTADGIIENEKPSELQINKTNNDNSINNDLQLIKIKKDNPSLKSNLLEELIKQNYAPKSVYFRIVAEELEAIHDEMLT